jgi:hypothetical protein
MYFHDYVVILAFDGPQDDVTSADMTTVILQCYEHINNRQNQ